MVATARSLELVDASEPTVDAVVHEPSRRRGPAVLLTHGAGGNLDDAGLVALAEVVAAAGHLAVRANLPYRQRRATGPPPRAERSVGDLAAMLAAARRLAPRTGWVVGGKSYGGRVATLLAAQGADVAGVLCHSYPLHPPGRPDRLRVAHFGDITAPLLFLQGGNDPFGGPTELAPYAATLPAGTRVVAVAGGDHSLRVPRTGSDDGRTHSPADVVAALAEEVAAWLDHLVATRRDLPGGSGQRK